jgi:uncharacterized membrane protein YphA (DoxX/SURF4 family)
MTSGWSDLTNPDARSKSIGMSKRLTIFLGASEVLGSLGVMAGVLTQWAALGLILIGLGAIQKKIFVWRSGFWGEKTYGWHTAVAIGELYWGYEMRVIGRQNRADESRVPGSESTMPAGQYVTHCKVPLHGAIGFVAPQDMLAGRQPQISRHAIVNSTPHA